MTIVRNPDSIPGIRPASEASGRDPHRRRLIKDVVVQTIMLAGKFIGHGSGAAAFGPLAATRDARDWLEEQHRRGYTGPAVEWFDERGHLLPPDPDSDK